MHKEDRELTYEDYNRIIKAKSGHWDKTMKDELAELQPYFDKGYLETNKEGDIWLTRKGVDILLAVGCDPIKPQEFLQDYPHMLDQMRQTMTVDDNDTKREFFRNMGFCECTYCAELFYDWDEYVQHDCGLQGVYPDGHNFTWTISKQPEMGSTALKKLPRKKLL